jgi:hypothetical protein
MMESRKVRRLVTGHNDAGKSVFIMDGEAASVLSMDSMGGLTITDLWETFDAPADNSGRKDNAQRPVHLEPSARGSIFRIVEFPPDAAWKNSGDADAAFAALQASHAADRSSTVPGMHKTSSVDYALVLEGEIWAVMDTEERLLQAGDVLVQRGTNHAWANKTDRNCRVMFVLCGADPV